MNIYINIYINMCYININNMIQIITSPDIIKNNKLSLKISKELDIFRVNIKDLVIRYNNLNECIINLNSLLEKHKSLIIYGQCIEYYNMDSLVNKLMEYIMSNLHYQLVIHNLKKDEDIIEEILSENIDKNKKAEKIKEAIYDNVYITEPYYKLNEYHRLRRYDNAIYFNEL
jgi:hypothetical protein